MDLTATQHVRATERALPGGGVLRCSSTNPGAERTDQISMRALGSTRGSRREATHDGGHKTEPEVDGATCAPLRAHLSRGVFMPLLLSSIIFRGERHFGGVARGR